MPVSAQPWGCVKLTAFSLLMCPPEHLHDQAGWDGPISSSRERLLSELSSESHASTRVFILRIF